MEQDFFKLGVQAANAEDYQKAQAYFIRVVQDNPNSEKGWLYLGHCLTDPEKRKTCYQRVLRINPSNQEAQRALSALSQPSRSEEVNQDPYERRPEPAQPTDNARQTPPAQAEYKKRPFNMITVIMGSVAGLVVCLGIVCFAITQMPATPRPFPTSTPAPTPTPSLPQLDSAVLPAPSVSTGAGKVCMGFWERGVTCLDERGWQTFDNSSLGVSDTYFLEGAFCPDGRLAIAHAYGFILGYDQQWEQIPDLAEEYGKVRDIVCDRDGRLWVAHQRGVSRYVDGAWQTYGLEALKTGEVDNEYVFTIEATPDGKIWVLTAKSVAVFADEKWTIFQEGQGLLEEPLSLTLDAAGRAWTWSRDGVAVYDNGVWTSFEATPPIFPTVSSFDARGWFWMGSSQGVAAYDGEVWLSHNMETQSLSSDAVSGLATDNLGRVWAATSYGLAVFDGSQWQNYRMDNSDLMDNSMAFVVVERDGPSVVMPPPADKEKSSLIGRLGYENGDPLPGKRVEICVEPVGDTFSGDTPCAGQPFYMSTQTDQDGAFVFENVPAGYYWMFVETNYDWAELIDELGFSGNQVLIQPGEQHDIGDLALVNK